jgi:signal transduction histidine kinase
MCFVRGLSLFRNTGFRFALLHTVGFILSTVESALENQARERVDIEVNSLIDEYRRAGLQGLRAAIEARSPDNKRLQYAVVDEQQHISFGDQDLAKVIALANQGTTLITLQSGGVKSDSILVGKQPLPDGLQLLVADDLQSVDDIEDSVLNAFLVALAMAVVFGVGVGALFTRSVLRRVDRVTRTADAIIGGDLSQRIPLTGSGDDFDRLSATLNAMLDRITDLLESLRQVSNDIAHDLRTPLARLRQRLEETRLRATSPADYSRAVDDAIGEADALLGTFTSLLRIAQVEAGAQRSSFSPVDLSDVLRTVADAYAPDIEDGGRTLTVDLPDGLITLGDRQLLVQLFANLIENAMRHTSPNARVAIRLMSVPETDTIRVEVSDNGPGIPEQERPKVFRRFYRLEHSRTTPGNGLGLSLVAGVAELHGAHIALADAAPGLTVIIEFRSTGRHGLDAGRVPV